MQPSFTLLEAAQFKRTPWKNGLGWTDQIAISPEGADLRRGDFDWRISTARVAQSADFSPFPDHDRVLVILEGAGVTLTHRFEESDEPEVVELPPWEPYEFPGDVPTRCELREGPIQDFSVFLRKGIISALVEAVEIRPGDPMHWEPQARTCLIFVAEGAVEAADHAVGASSVLRIDRGNDPGPLNLTLSTNGGARVLLVQLDHA